MLRDSENLLAQCLRTLVIELRQRGDIPPALIFFGVLLEVEIAAVRTVRIAVSPGGKSVPRVVDALAVHPFMEGAAVVEHAVEDDPHSAPVRLLAEPGEIRVADGKIVCRRNKL